MKPVSTWKIGDSIYMSLDGWGEDLNNIPRSWDDYKELFESAVGNGNFTAIRERSQPDETSTNN